MTIAIYFTVIIFNGYLAFNKKDEKHILYSSLFFLLIFMLGNFTAPDYLSYQNDYLTISAGHVSAFPELGFVFLEKFFINLGFNFSFFRLMIIIFSFLLIYKGLKYYKVNPHFIISLFMIYQLFMDTMQLRNLLAYSIFTYALHFIIINDISYNKLKYLILMSIATSIHFSISLYFILLLKDFFENHNKILKSLLCCSLLISIIFFLFPGTRFILVYLMNLVGKGYLAERYITNVRSIAFVLPLLSTLLYFLIHFIYLKYNNYNNKLAEFNSKGIVIINKISILYLPLMVIDATWYRVIRNLNIINYTDFWIKFDSISNKKFKVLFFLSVYVIAILWFFVECVNWIGLDIIQSMLYYNGFFI